MARPAPAVLPFNFVPPPPNVRRCLELAARVARLYGLEDTAAVTVRTRAAGPIGNLTVAFATVGGREVAAGAPRDGEMAALDDFEASFFGV